MEFVQPLEQYGNFTTTGKVWNFTTTGTLWNFYGDDNK
jgi:hypothetical protein